MDFTTSEQTETFRQEVRDVIKANYTEAEQEELERTGTKHSWPLHRALAKSGMLGAAWPVEEGGQGRSAHEMDVLYEEAARAGAPMAGFSTTMLVAETIRRVGTEEQRSSLLPGVLAGETLFALGYSEANVGSDVAAVRTQAVQQPDGSWIIDGEKAFTTTAEEASYVFVLARTNQELKRHRGLSIFLVPIDAPGLTIAPFHTMAGERSNMTHFSSVSIPDSARVGEIDGGWQVMLVALDFERGGEFAAELQRLVDIVEDYVASRPEELTGAALSRIGRLVTETEVAKLLGSSATALRSAGKPANLEGTMAKLFATEALQFHSSEMLDILGVAGLVRTPGATSAIEGMYRHAFVTTIYGGTSEVLRGIIAERWLQLPRSQRAAGAGS